MRMREQYSRKMSQYFLFGLLLHWPVFAWLASRHPNTGILASLGIALFLMLPPLILHLLGRMPNIVPSLIAFSSIGYSALLIHLGQGMIELHFHIFVTLAALVAFGLLTPIVVGVGVTAVHHLGFFFLLPKSVFNYESNTGNCSLARLFCYH